MCFLVFWKDHHIWRPGGLGGLSLKIKARCKHTHFIGILCAFFLYLWCKEIDLVGMKLQNPWLVLWESFKGYLCLFLIFSHSISWPPNYPHKNILQLPSGVLEIPRSRTVLQVRESSFWDASVKHQVCPLGRCQNKCCQLHSLAQG